MDRQALAGFLRDRRERLRPADVGLVPLGRRPRRTPGLRREEVAERAGVSIDYYERLEQARAAHPSAQVVEALAGALRLSGPDRDHLERLAGYAVGRVRESVTEVPPGVGLLLDRLGPIAGYVCDAGQNVLAWNKLAAALTIQLETVPPSERTLFGLARRLGGTTCAGLPATGGADAPVTGGSGDGRGEGGRSGGPVDEIDASIAGADTRGRDGGPRVSDDGAGGFAAQSAAHLRTALARYPGDAELRQVADRMAADEPAFAASWRRQQVRVPNTVRKRLFHPVMGELQLDCQSLDIPDADLRVLLYSAEPGSESHEKLRRLAPDR